MILVSQELLVFVTRSLQVTSGRMGSLPVASGHFSPIKNLDFFTEATWCDLKRPEATPCNPGLKSLIFLFKLLKRKIEPTVHEYSYFTVFHILGEVAAQNCGSRLFPFCSHVIANNSLSRWSAAAVLSRSSVNTDKLLTQQKNGKRWCKSEKHPQCS